MRQQPVDASRRASSGCLTWTVRVRRVRGNAFRPPPTASAALKKIRCLCCDGRPGASHRRRGGRWWSLVAIWWSGGSIWPGGWRRLAVRAAWRPTQAGPKDLICGRGIGLRSEDPPRRPEPDRAAAPQGRDAEPTAGRTRPWPATGGRAAASPRPACRRPSWRLARSPRRAVRQPGVGQMTCFDAESRALERAGRSAGRPHHPARSTRPATAPSSPRTARAEEAPTPRSGTGGSPLAARSAPPVRARDERRWTQSVDSD
jgi:hypothetical protein